VLELEQALAGKSLETASAKAKAKTVRCAHSKSWELQDLASLTLVPRTTARSTARSKAKQDQKRKAKLLPWGARSLFGTQVVAISKAPRKIY
jgi:hypothetical protein